MKKLLLLRQQMAQLAGRDLDPEFVQLLQQQRLGHMLMMVLVQRVAYQFWPKVAVHRVGQLAPQPLAIRSLPFFQPIAEVARLDHQILHHVIRVPFETPSLLAGIRRQAFRGNHLIDRFQLRCLRTLRTALALFAWLLSSLRFLVHSAWLDERLALVTLQASDLFLLLFYLLLARAG